jgi:hypothetical protein
LRGELQAWINIEEMAELTVGIATWYFFPFHLLAVDARARSRSIAASGRSR